MVQFAQKLKLNMIESWEDYYVDYDRLKKLIKKIKSVAKPKYYKTFPEEDVPLDPYEYDATGTGSEEEHTLLNMPTGNRRRGASRIIRTYGTTTSDKIKEHLDRFQKAIEEEAAKVEDFYRTKLSEYEAQVERLAEQAKFNRQRVKLRGETFDADTFEDSVDLPRHVLTAESVKWAFTQVYERINYLHSYTILNYTAFVKILKKLDKATGFQMKRVLLKKVHKYKEGFCEATDVLFLQKQVETLVADTFYQSNLVLARSELLTKHSQLTPLESFHTGARIGVTIILLLWVCWNVMMDLILVPEEDQMPQDIVRVYRAVGLFFMCFWCWYFCVSTFVKFRVNYIYMFEFDPRRAFGKAKLLNYASFHSIMYLGNLLLYYKAARDEIPFLVPARNAYMVPVSLVFYSFGVMVLPVHETFTIYRVLSRIVLAPCYEVTFFAAFIGDIFTSLIRPIVDYSFIICFYITSEWTTPGNKDRTDQGFCDGQLFNGAIIPIITALPLLIRCAQNFRRFKDTHKRWPHTANAMKYAFAAFLTMFGAVHANFANDETENTFRILWVIGLTISSIYTYLWDIWIDWGLENRSEQWIREQRMYVSKWPYYTAMFFDLFLRISWSFTLIPFDAYKGSQTKYIVVDVIAFLEILRRTVWIMLRVEYEHLSNSQGYRRVDYIPLHCDLPPSDSEKKDTDPSVIAELVVFVSLVMMFLVMALFSK